jgi:hypothetical protein
LEKHRVFNEFLQQVIEEKDENKEFDDIEALQHRFRNLKNENIKLMNRKNEIYKEMEDARSFEKQKMNTM